MGRVILIVGVLLTTVSPAFAQSSTNANWKQGRTPDGQPDLTGTWTTQTYTPLERPQRYANQEFLTEEEAAELSCEAREGE